MAVRTVKGIILGIVSSIVIFILIMTWFYPYSFFSVHKSVSYKPDPVVINEYVKDLKEFKDTYNKSLAKDRSQNILTLYEQDWLVEKDPIKMNENEIDSILFKVNEAKNNSLKLIVQNDYTSEQRQYLVDVIKNLLSLEDLFLDIKNNKFETRSTLSTEFHNLQQDFINSFNLFKTFCEVSQSK